MGCLYIKIKSWLLLLLLFLPRGILHFQFVFISRITVKGAVNKSNGAHCEEEESGEIMQAGLSVMDSLCNRTKGGKAERETDYLTGVMWHACKSGGVFLESR